MTLVEERTVELMSERCARSTASRVSLSREIELSRPRVRRCWPRYRRDCFPTPSGEPRRSLLKIWWLNFALWRNGDLWLRPVDSTDGSDLSDWFYRWAVENGERFRFKYLECSPTVKRFKCFNSWLSCLSRVPMTFSIFQPVLKCNFLFETFSLFLFETLTHSSLHLIEYHVNTRTFSIVLKFLL